MRAGGAGAWPRLGVGLAFLLLMSGCAAQILEDDDDVSAGYDNDGMLLLDSQNLRGMTQQGIWIVMFYSYSVVIKRREEAYDCQRMSFLFGDLAERLAELGGTPKSGSTPSIHVAKFDTSSETERRFASMLLSSSRIDSLPAIVIFEGSTQIKMPERLVQQIVQNFPDLDRLEGYSQDMTCDPPSDHYDAREKNEANLYTLIHWLNDHLLTTGRGMVEIPDWTENMGPPDDPGVDWEWNAYDPTDQVLELAREAVRSGDRAPLLRLLERMDAVNGTGVDCRCPLTLQTSLHFAAIAGEASVAALLAQVGADLEAACIDGETPLHKAAEGARRGAVRELLAHGAWPNAPRHSDGATPLHMAGLTGEGDVCSLLVREGADVELRTPKGQSALHFAALGGYVHPTASAEALVALGADLDGKDNMGWTPLMMAVYSGEEGMASKLLSLGADLEARDHSGNSVLHHAVQYSIEGMVLLLLRHGADVYASNRAGEKVYEVNEQMGNWKKDPATGQMLWTGKTKTKFDNLFLSYRRWWFPFYWFGPMMRPDITHKVITVEHHLRGWLAAKGKVLQGYFRKNWHTFFRFHLLDEGGRTKFEIFTQRRLYEVEEKISEKTPGGNPTGDIFLFLMGDPEYERLKTYTELQRTVYCGETYLVEQLLQDKRVTWAADPKSPESDISQMVIPSTGGGMVASGNGMLRGSGSDVDIENKDEEGATPLMVAAARCDMPTLEVLVRYGADPDATDHFGWTALMRAARAGDVQVVRVLLAAGASVDKRNKGDQGQTALMLAAANGHVEVMEAVVFGGADLDCEDASQRTPLNYANSARQTKAMAWFRKRGACLSVDGICTGAAHHIRDLPTPDTADYNPADFPEGDVRNPRYVGK